jgi:hypothetical protein
MEKKQPAAVLDLYVEEPVLGSNGHVLGGSSRFVREARVEFGKLTVAAVPDDRLPELARRRLDLPRWRFTQVFLPFDLQELPDNQRYVAATVRLTFDDSEVSSLGLSQPPEDASGDSQLDTWGVGRPELTWKLTARDERRGLRPSGRLVQAMLASPMPSDRLTGTLDARVDLTRSVLGHSMQSTAEPRQPLRFAFGFVADEPCEFVPDQ